MNLTLDEIATHRVRLRQEIMERECLLAAFDVVEKYAASGHAPNPMQLGGLVSALLPQPALELKEISTPAAPAALPAPRLQPAYMHPELRALSGNWGSHHGMLVAWAIEHLTGDYSLHDIAALLRREGKPLRKNEISVVLSRLKARGEIEEIKPGAGPHPAVFRGPESAQAPEPEASNGTTLTNEDSFDGSHRIDSVAVAC